MAKTLDEVLRGLKDSEKQCHLEMEGGSSHGGKITRIGDDFVEVESPSEGKPVTYVRTSAIVAISVAPDKIESRRVRSRH